MSWGLSLRWKLPQILEYEETADGGCKVLNPEELTQFRVSFWALSKPLLILLGFNSLVASKKIDTRLWTPTQVFQPCGWELEILSWAYFLALHKTFLWYSLWEWFWLTSPCGKKPAFSTFCDIWLVNGANVKSLTGSSCETWNCQSVTNLRWQTILCSHWKATISSCKGWRKTGFLGDLCSDGVASVSYTGPRSAEVPTLRVTQYFYEDALGWINQNPLSLLLNPLWEFQKDPGRRE